MVVGAGPTAPPSKKQAAARREAATLKTVKGDPAAVVVAPAVKDDRDKGRPDKAAYDAEQDGLRADIEALQTKLNAVKAEIQAGGKDAQQERKQQLRTELDGLRAEQARVKGTRGKSLDQVKNSQDALQKRIKDLQAAKSKSNYKSTAEVDAQIKALEAKINTGTMKLPEEKKALNDISQLKKTRKVVESFNAQQAEIDAQKASLDSLRSGIDHSEAKALADKFNSVRAELDSINAAHDERYKAREGLFEKRNGLSKELDDLFAKKKASASAYREANDKFYQKMQEDRQKRLEKRKTEQAEYESSKREAAATQIREEAAAPAFEREIEDCRTLVDSFLRRLGKTPTEGTNGNAAGLGEKKELKGVPKLEERKVEAAVPEGSVALKKKGEQDEEMWGGLGGKAKGKKGRKGAAAAPAEGAAEKEKEDDKLNLPFGTLSALLTLGIAAPLTVSDLEKTVEQLQTKKQYFVDNQEKVTKERIAAAEKKIAAAEQKALDAAANASNNDHNERDNRRDRKGKGKKDQSGPATPAEKETAAPASKAETPAPAANGNGTTESHEEDDSSSPVATAATPSGGANSWASVASKSKSQAAVDDSTAEGETTSATDEDNAATASLEEANASATTADEDEGKEDKKEEEQVGWAEA